MERAAKTAPRPTEQPAAAEPAPASAAAPATPPPPQKKGAPWWLALAVIFGLLILGVVFVMFRTSPDDKPVATDTGSARPVSPPPQHAAAPEAGTVMEVTETRTQTAASVTQPPISAAPSPAVTATRPPAATATGSPGSMAGASPVVVTPPAAVPHAQAPRPQPAPQPGVQVPQPQPEPQPPPQPQPSPQPREAAPQRSVISESEAVEIARNFIAGQRVYGISADCLSVRSEGYINVGYTLDALDVCAAPGVARQLGRWRVDALTREVFRQDRDGRYRRP